MKSIVNNCYAINKTLIYKILKIVRCTKAINWLVIFELLAVIHYFMELINLSRQNYEPGCFAVNQSKIIKMFKLKHTSSKYELKSCYTEKYQKKFNEFTLYTI